MKLRYCLFFGYILFIFSATANYAGTENIGDSNLSLGMPKSIHEVEIDPYIQIPMRDGILLAADIYRPIGVADKLPVILIQTPYSRKDHRDGTTWGVLPSAAHFFASQGYAVVVQDVRGKFESEGTFVNYGGLANDGFDTVEWLAKQPWSNGKVGSYGCSYGGDAQILMSQTKPPALKAMIPQAAGASVGSVAGRNRHSAFHYEGTRALAVGVGWMHQYGSKVFLKYPEGLSRDELLKIDAVSNTLPGGEFPKGNIKGAWKVLPLTDIPKFLDSLPSDFIDVMTREITDPWWESFDYLDDQATFDVPALHVNSWYDYGVNETILEWQVFQEKSLSKQAQDNQFLIISPTEHCASEILASESTRVGERDLGDTRFPYWTTYLKWFDYWLKGDNDAITDIPKVQYFMMGANEWRSSEVWPPAGTEFKKFYLHSGGKANSRYGDGTLSQTAPTAEQTADRYTYDPDNPVPSLGGAMCCTGSKESVAGSFDQSELELRNDVLVYTSEPLKETLEIAGPIEVTLYVGSDAKDTDFVAKLTDVYPDGGSFNLQEGIIRARYREGFEQKVWMEKEQVYKVTIKLDATANAFLPGHRIRLQVTSSNFPARDRNLNTGGNNFDETEWVVAENKIHHSKQYPSHIQLPIQTE